MEGRAESAPRWGALVAEVCTRALWPPVAVLVLHAVLSLGFGAYDSFPLLDAPMHVLGGIAIAAAFERTLAALRRQGWVGAVEAEIAAALIVGLSCLAAFVWECAEFASDRYLGTRAQVDIADTLVDMGLGISGAASYLAARLWLARRLA